MAAAENLLRRVVRRVRDACAPFAVGISLLSPGSVTEGLQFAAGDLAVGDRPTEK